MKNLIIKISLAVLITVCLTSCVKLPEEINYNNFKELAMQDSLVELIDVSDTSREYTYMEVHIHKNNVVEASFLRGAEPWSKLILFPDGEIKLKYCTKNKAYSYPEDIVDKKTVDFLLDQYKSGWINYCKKYKK